MGHTAAMDQPRVMNTSKARKCLDEAHAILLYLDDKDITDEVEWNGMRTTAAILLSVAQNRLRLAAELSDHIRLAYFGFPEQDGLR